MGGGVKVGNDVEVVQDEANRSELLAVGVIEHALKTDATVVHGWATTLDESWDDLSDEQKREAVRIIRRRSAALAESARKGLTAVAGTWPGTEPLATAGRPPRNDLAKRVREITATMAGAALDHVIRYKGPMSLHVDRRVDIDGVERAVQQLIENAAKYSLAGSEIVVSVRGGARGVAIDVIDEGVGVPGGDDLFDPFVRHNGQTATEGSGLGLFMVRSAIEASGGRVSARRNQQWGSTFHIELPTR